MKQAKVKFILASLVIMLLSSFVLAQTKLDFWSWRVEDIDEYNQIIQRFEAENPGIDVEFQAFEASTYNTVLTSALTAGEGPDIIHVRAYGNFETIAEPGFLLPLNDKVPALEAFPKLAVQGQTLRSDGQVYAVPFASQTLLVYYNQSIFDELGLTPPETWNEFLAAAQAIKDAGLIPIANGTATAWMDEVLVGALAPSFYGADFYNEVITGETDFTDQRFVGALKKLLELRPYLAPDFEGVDYATAQNLFLNELAGIFIGGSWEIANFRDQNPDLNFDIMAPPAAEAGSPRLVSWFLDGGYAVNADTENQDVAVKFANFLASQEFGQQLTDTLANISPVPGVEPNDPLLKKVADFNKNATPYIMLVGFRYEEPTGSVLLQERLPGMFAGNISPEQVAKETTEGIAGYYEPFQ